MTYSQIHISSPIGDIIAVANSDFLVLLEFTDSKELKNKIEKIEKKFQTKIIEWSNRILDKTHEQLAQYFAHTRTQFDIPLNLNGTIFQLQSWKALQAIPYWETRSYQEQSIACWNPKAVRAIGWANHNNPIVIIVPCHRVIWKSGKLVGYGGGLDRKIWLLNHEQNNS